MLSTNCPFKEIQKMPVWISWTSLFVPFLSLFIVWKSHGLDFSTMFIGILFAISVSWLLSMVRLETIITDGFIAYRLYPLQIHFREIRKSEVVEAYIRKYKPIVEYGGWGLRFGRSGRAVNLRGNWGVQLVFKSGRKLLIGTGQVDLMQRALIGAGFIPKP